MPNDDRVFFEGHEINRELYCFAATIMAAEDLKNGPSAEQLRKIGLRVEGGPTVGNPAALQGIVNAAEAAGWPPPTREELGQMMAIIDLWCCGEIDLGIDESDSCEQP